MNYFNKWQQKKNPKWLFTWLVFVSVLLLFKEIIESWYLLYAVIFLILSVIIYFACMYIVDKNKDKPVSLWKEYDSKYPIIIQYAPPKWVNPAEAWLLYNLKVDPTDLTSLIYQWKFEKLIDIKTFKWKNSGRDYIKLIKLDEMPLSRPFFESEIFDSLFALSGVKVIEWAFQLRYALMLEDLELHWIKKWRIYKSSWWKKFYWLYNFLVALFSISLFWLISWKMIPYTSYLLCISLILFMACVLLWWYMYKGWDLKFTDKWAKLASHIIGYRNFIKSCDENKIRLFLKEDPLFVDRTLPYATAFWMETEFLNKVSPLIKDRNAKYIRWRKVTIWMKLFSFFFSDNEDDSEKYTYWW